MNARAAELCRFVAKRECEKRNVPYTKFWYRQIKKVYNQVPWNKRHLFG